MGVFGSIRQRFSRNRDEDYFDDEFMMYEDQDMLRPNIDDPWDGSRTP